jgi:hypothetical protein
MTNEIDWNVGVIVDSKVSPQCVCDKKRRRGEGDYAKRSVACHGEKEMAMTGSPRV